MHDKHDLGIKDLTKVCAASRQELHRYIAESPQFFESPKTRTFDFVRVGFIRQKPHIAHDNVDLVLARIMTFLPDKYEELTRTKTSLSVDALKNLSDDERELIGVAFMGGGDVPSIKIIQPEINKILRQIEQEAGDE